MQMNTQKMQCEAGKPGFEAKAAIVPPGAANPVPKSKPAVSLALPSVMPTSGSGRDTQTRMIGPSLRAGPEQDEYLLRLLNKGSRPPQQTGFRVPDPVPPQLAPSRYPSSLATPNPTSPTDTAAPAAAAQQQQQQPAINPPSPSPPQGAAAAAQQRQQQPLPLLMQQQQGKGSGPGTATASGQPTSEVAAGWSFSDTQTCMGPEAANHLRSSVVGHQVAFIEQLYDLHRAIAVQKLLVRNCPEVKPLMAEAARILISASSGQQHQQHQQQQPPLPLSKDAVAAFAAAAAAAAAHAGMNTQDAYMPPAKRPRREGDRDVADEQPGPMEDVNDGDNVDVDMQKAGEEPCLRPDSQFAAVPLPGETAATGDGSGDDGDGSGPNGSGGNGSGGGSNSPQPQVPPAMMHPIGGTGGGAGGHHHHRRMAMLQPAPSGASQTPMALAYPRAQLLPAPWYGGAPMGAIPYPAYAAPPAFAVAPPPPPPPPTPADGPSTAHNPANHPGAGVGAAAAAAAGPAPAAAAPAPPPPAAYQDPMMWWYQQYYGAPRGGPAVAVVAPPHPGGGGGSGGSGPGPPAAPLLAQQQQQQQHINAAVAAFGHQQPVLIHPQRWWHDCHATFGPAGDPHVVLAAMKAAAAGEAESAPPGTGTGTGIVPGNTPRTVDPNSPKATAPAAGGAAAGNGGKRTKVGTVTTTTTTKKGGSRQQMPPPSRRPKRKPSDPIEEASSGTTGQDHHLHHLAMTDDAHFKSRSPKVGGAADTSAAARLLLSMSGKASRVPPAATKK